MKKVKNVFLLALLLIPMLFHSQIRFGIRGTVHASNVSNIHKESGSRIAGSLGALAQIPIGYSNQFFLQPEISYSLQGENDKGESYGVRRDAQYFQNYINIPVYFRAYFSEADNEFFGEIGPQIGFLVFRKDKEEDTSIHEGGYAFLDKPQSIDISIGIGIGYSFLRRYEVFVRYNYGLTDVYKNDRFGQQRTSVLAGGFAYVFD
ncbi:MAG: PorT family protein [Flavobacteriaceae bacterium]|jgi:hypothetical protein|nr:PorT family protein [Flavobacteriaceae bacterium]